MRRSLTLLSVIVSLAAIGCGPSTPTPTTPPPNAGEVHTPPLETTVATVAPPEMEPPPEPGQAPDLSFPDIVRTTLPNGLEINTVRLTQLPVAYVELYIKSGQETDPADKPGLSSIVASMLQEGTRSKSSAELAEAIDFLGADMWNGSGEESLYVGIRSLNNQFDTAVDLVADVVQNPSFRSSELTKLKRRELDRLRLSLNNPNYLASREFYARLYGEHPYGRMDATPESVEAISRGDLVRWHRKYVRPNNAFLIVVGDVDPAAVEAAATRAFGSWQRRDVPEVTYPEPPTRTQREVVVVDRPGSAQSVISIGNLAIERSHADYVPLQVANQVLGGSAASRLFMDLREARSLTYGAYTSVGQSVKIGVVRGRTSSRTDVTPQAMEAFMEHLYRIRAEAVPDAELANAKRYLVDSFPLRIQTPGRIVNMIADLRTFGLPDDYWDTYRSQIATTAAPAAQAAATAHVRPDEALIVVVGNAAEIAEPLRVWGPVTVIDPAGEVVSELTAAPAQETSAPAEAAATEAAPAAEAPAAAE